MMRLLALVLLTMVSMAPDARAHALLARAVPPVGGESVGAPRQLVLTFTEGVEPLFSTIEVRDANGAVVQTSKPRTSPGNNRQLVIELPALGNGEYVVIWHATSVDTHKTEGSYRFTVK